MKTLSTKHLRIDLIVNFVLNCYGDLENPAEVLNHYLKNETLTKYVLSCLKDCAKDSPLMYRQLFKPEVNDATLRRWVKGILDEYS